MRSIVAERFRAWCAREEDGRALRNFRFVFVLIWLAYDAFDLALGGTANAEWLLPTSRGHGLGALQVGLLAAQGLLLVGVWPEVLALLCAALRLAEAIEYLSLNDFYFYVVVMVILSQARFRKDGRALAWPRDFLIAQAAWIYFATGLLKLNPEWLGGGHLFVRIQYLRVVYQWPYPNFFAVWTARLSHDAILAWMGAGLELALAGLLLCRGPRSLTIAAAIALHGFAALATNVWFFGAAMVALVSLARKRKSS